MERKKVLDTENKLNTKEAILLENKWLKIGINSVYIISFFIFFINYFRGKLSLEIIPMFTALFAIESFIKYELTKSKKYIIPIAISGLLFIAAIVSLISTIIK